MKEFWIVFRLNMEPNELAFYRKLFLIRYARLLEKAEQTYKLPTDVVEDLRTRILSLDWIDGGVNRMSRTGTQ